MKFAPTIDADLVCELARLDDRSAPYAETHRALGEVANALGYVRPSYEQTRLLIHEIRRVRAERRRIRDEVLSAALTYRVPLRVLRDPHS